MQSSYGSVFFGTPNTFRANTIQVCPFRKRKPRPDVSMRAWTRVGWGQCRGAHLAGEPEQLLHREDLGRDRRRRLLPLAVQVDAAEVAPIVADDHAVGVEHRQHLPLDAVLRAFGCIVRLAHERCASIAQARDKTKCAQTQAGGGRGRSTFVTRAVVSADDSVPSGFRGSGFRVLGFWVVFTRRGRGPASPRRAPLVSPAETDAMAQGSTNGHQRRRQCPTGSGRRA